MAVFERAFYLSSDSALPDIGRAAFLFAQKTGIEFRLPQAKGDFLCVLFRDGEPFLFLSFEPIPCALPVFNKKAINGTSAMAVGVIDESGQEYVNKVLDEIQDLQKGERCSIVLSSTRRGWLKWGQTYGFYYIGRHRETTMFCFERA